MEEEGEGPFLYVGTCTKVLKFTVHKYYHHYDQGKVGSFDGQLGQSSSDISWPEKGGLFRPQVKIRCFVGRDSGYQWGTNNSYLLIYSCT